MATIWCYTYRYSWLPRLSSAMPSCAVADRGASSTGTPLAIGRSCTPPHESRKQRPQCPAMSERDLHSHYIAKSPRYRYTHRVTHDSFFK